MSVEIVNVLPVEKYFSIDWQIGIRCNYDCMYCSPEWHDSHSPSHDLTTLKQAWIQIYKKTQHTGLPYKIAFTGGELTTSKHFMPFVSWLRETYNNKIFKLLLSTNGSATFKYYLKLFGAVDNITFSVHSEHINEQKFFDTVIKLKNSIDQTKFIQVAIMKEHWNLNRIPMYINLLDQHNISYTVNEVDYSVQTRSIPIMKGKLNLEV